MLGSVLAALDAHPIANSPHPDARTLHPGTAGAPGRMQLSDDQDVLASVDVLVNLGSDLIEGLGPVSVVPPPAPSTSVETSLGLILGDEQLDVGVDELELALQTSPAFTLSVSKRVTSTFSCDIAR
jgi:hypothetical protein